MKAARQLSIAILVTLFAASLFGSYQMIMDPSGNSLGLPYYLLNGTIITSYASIGWVSLFTLSLFSAVVIICILLKSSIYSFLIILQGVILCIFVLIVILLLGEIFLVQYLFIAAGIGLVGLGILQNQRKIAIESERKNETPPKSHHHKHRKR
jgi:hypothetical protein